MGLECVTLNEINQSEVAASQKAAETGNTALVQLVAQQGGGILVQIFSSWVLLSKGGGVVWKKVAPQLGELWSLVNV